MNYQIGRIGRVVVARAFDGENVYGEIESLAARENIRGAAVHDNRYTSGCAMLCSIISNLLQRFPAADELLRIDCMGFAAFARNGFAVVRFDVVFHRNQRGLSAHGRIFFQVFEKIGIRAQYGPGCAVERILIDFQGLEKRIKFRVAVVGMCIGICRLAVGFSLNHLCFAICFG